jgi:hypothetical protein
LDGHSTIFRNTFALLWETKIEFTWIPEKIHGDRINNVKKAPAMPKGQPGKEQRMMMRILEYG